MTDRILTVIAEAAEAYWDQQADAIECIELRTATTPLERAMAQIDIAWCNWALVHDITEQLFGDPDWWKASE